MPARKSHRWQQWWGCVCCFVSFSLKPGTMRPAMTPARVIWFAVIPMLGAWLGCNAIIGLELGRPEETDDGDTPSSSSGSGPPATTGTGTTGSSGSGGNGGSGGSGGSAECPGNQLQTLDPVCQVCLETGCCAQLVACSDDPQCVGLLGCEVSCPMADQACIDECMAANSAGQPPYDALYTCIEAVCGTDCGAFNGEPICDSGFALPAKDPAAAACAACLGAPGCCEDFTACADDAACVDCVSMGNAASCDASALDEALGVCFEACAAECG